MRLEWRFPTGVLAVLAALALVSDLAAQNWPQWRGPEGRGVATAKDLPVTWKEGENILWKAPLPGKSGATPALWGDRLFVSTPEGKDLLLYCIGTDGKLLWKEKLGSGNRQMGFNSKNNFATPSPATDGEHVWVLVGTGDLACFTVAGKEVWRRKLTDAHGAFTQDFGLGSSFLLHEDKLFCPCIHRGAESYVLAIDKRTGKDVWKVFRPTDAVEESLDAYTTPAIVQANGKSELVIVGADWITAHDPANGAELWRHGALNLRNNPTLRIIVTPVAADGKLFVTSAKRGPLYCIAPGGQSDVTESRRLWTCTQDTPDVATPAVHEGKLVMVKENGVVSCLATADGKLLWKSERLAGGNFFSSPLVADGKIYVTAEKGVVHVLKFGDTFEKLATNDLKEFILSSPVPADGRLYFRTEKHLVCVGK